MSHLLSEDFYSNTCTLLEIFLDFFLHRVSAQIPFWETLRWLIFILNHVTDMFPVNLISWKMFSFSVFFKHFVHREPTFLRCVPSNSKWANIFHEIIKCVIINIWCFLCLIINNTWLYEFYKPLHSTLIYTTSKHFGAWGCTSTHHLFCYFMPKLLLKHSCALKWWMHWVSSPRTLNSSLLST